MRILGLLLVVLAGVLWIGGCGGNDGGADAVRLYTSVDEPVARPIVQEFTRRTGIKVNIRTDTEASKSVGLAQRLEAEKDNPQADVWWGNEAFNTVNLAEAGLFEAYASPSALMIPPMYKDAENRWAGTSLRVRVLARTTVVNDATLKYLTSVGDLIDPAFKGKICMARPTAGTTAGHMAALYTLMGPDRMELFYQAMKANEVRLLGGNSVVAEFVSSGQMWAGLTDNDDVDSLIKQGGKLEMVTPDQGPNQVGALVMPCTVGLVAKAKHAEAGKKLVDYLLSAEVEKKLMDAKFAKYSVFLGPKEPLRVMAVDYKAAAKNMKAAAEMGLRVLEGRE